MRDRNELFIRRRTIKHTIKVLESTALSAKENRERIRELERQLRKIEEQLGGDT